MRSYNLQVRINESELNDLILKSELAKISKPEYCRRAIVSSTIQQNDEEYQKRKLYLLANLSNNINQIAHHANTHKTLDQKVLSQLEQISLNIKKMW